MLWGVRRLAAASGLAVLVMFLVAVSSAGAQAGAPSPTHGAPARVLALNTLLRAQSGEATLNSLNSSPGDSDLADESAEYGFERSAPAQTVSGDAVVSAAQQAAALPVSGGTWQDVTTVPYNAQPTNYTDPFWSNIGAGFSIVGGRTTALAASGGVWYAGTADGGVWSSGNQGQTWTPIFDAMPTLSIGALAVDPVDGSVWVGTGEANTNADSYDGTGVYRAAAGTTTFSLVGAPAAVNPLVSRTIYAITFDPAGDAYAATDNGLFRFDASAHTWSEVLDPTKGVDNPPYDNQVTSVQVVPGTSGQDVIAAIGWRGGGTVEDEHLENNGFYESTDGGHTFTEVTLSGDIDASDIGRTTFAYSADGTKLYAIVESPADLTADDETSLQGVFVASGSPASVAGPWTKIADEATLAASGSALAVGSGYGVGVQSWYNQVLAVDPNDANHVYLGLEEVFETTDGGQSWVTASPYWNYGLTCGASCPNTTHPDQHAMMIADGQIVIGNDGGVYSRPLSDDAQYGGWSDLNNTLASWQYYDGRAGVLPGGGTGVVGGLQDNGTSVLDSGASQMVEPAGGDGFDVIVDPLDANRMVGEYADGTQYSSTDGGHSFYSEVSPGCDGQAEVGETPLTGCDPSMRFAAPLVQDQQNPNVWVTGGEYVWVSTDGWNTSCTSSGCSWQNVFDTGANNAVTALSSTGNGKVIYAAWVGGGGNPGPTFGRGIATNFGGTWHQVSTAGLPDRYIAGITVDPADPAHAYAVFNGYSRRWIPGGGVGHVYETYNGGASWQNISTDLPDIASDALVISHGRLALATDQGMFTAPAYRGLATRWSRLGTGLPNASVNDVTPGPNGYLYAATHGRGIWKLFFGL